MLVCFLRYATNGITNKENNMEAKKFFNELEGKLLNPNRDLKNLSAEEQFDIIMSKVGEFPNSVVSEETLLEKLRLSKKNGKPLKIKFGIDPTGSQIHLGHAVPLLNLRMFQNMGHEIIMVIGDFTAMIGDPSGRNTEREALTHEMVVKNMATYEKQASKIIDFNSPNITKHFNSEWMDKLTIPEWIKFQYSISVTEVFQREDFKKRIEAGGGITMAELEYACYMGYDSVVLKPDIELGGKDQFLNLHMCRNMMRIAGEEPEVIITYNILSGTTGAKDEEGRFQKMSKSLKNYIAVEEKAGEMYGQVMSITDDVMWLWFRELTSITPKELDELKLLVNDGQLHPKDVKSLLARIIVASFNNFDMKIVREAENNFNSKFGRAKQLVPDDTKKVVVKSDETVISVLAEATNNSKSQINRILSGNGLKILRDNEYVLVKKEELLSEVENFDGCVFKVGKRNFIKIIVK